MSNNKQSSVEWLYEKLLNGELNIFQWQKYLEQAKAMHKEEMFEYIKQIYCIGHRSLEFHRLEFEKYYNETFKNNL